ncbi:MAG: helix-turn-helix transcriptional regulator [Alphaproteobacteria bacterium]|nr:helix-turn-helix transcriptional regulator [Alphaproteobacteria bacterium]
MSGWRPWDREGHGGLCPSSRFAPLPVDPGGARLRALMRSRGITPEELAAVLGVGASTVMRWCTGRRAPTPEMLGRVAAALGVTVEETGITPWVRPAPRVKW